MKPTTEILQSAIDALETANANNRLNQWSTLITDQAITELRELLARSSEPFTPAELVVMNEGYIHAKAHGFSQPTTSAQPLTDERKAAEHEYCTTAFNYPEAPIGSRDWTLYLAGWLARSTHKFTASPEKAND